MTQSKPNTSVSTVCTNTAERTLYSSVAGACVFDRGFVSCRRHGCMARGTGSVCLFVHFLLRNRSEFLNVDCRLYSVPDAGRRPSKLGTAGPGRVVVTTLTYDRDNTVSQFTQSTATVVVITMYVCLLLQIGAAGCRGGGARRSSRPPRCSLTSTPPCSRYSYTLCHHNI